MDFKIPFHLAYAWNFKVSLLLLGFYRVQISISIIGETDVMLLKSFLLAREYEDGSPIPRSFLTRYTIQIVKAIYASRKVTSFQVVVMQSNL